MAHRYQHPPFSESLSTLRFPSSGWVSEMLTQKWAQCAENDARTMRLKKENKRDRRIHNCIRTIFRAIEALKVPANCSRSDPI